MFRTIAQTLVKYVKLYGYFLRFSFSRALEFRLDFFFRIFMDFAFYVVQFAFFTVLYEHTDLLGGWNLDQIYVFIGGVFLVDAIHMTVFSNNLWWLPIYVNRGDLDYYLVRPVSSLFFLSLREFAANSFLNLAMAASFTAWAIWRYPEPLGALDLLRYGFLLCVGSLLYYLVRMAFIVPVFWMHSSRGLDEITWSLNKLSDRPHQIYHPYLRWTLLSILPVAFASSFPAHALFDPPGATGWIHVTIVTCLFFAFVVWFWQRGLRAYSSASS